MPFDWAEFLDCAKSLEQSTDEACLRTCISRSYYAAYSTAVMRLQRDNVQIPRGVYTHEYVWWYFEETDMVKDASQTIADVSWELKRKRIQADYRETATFTARDAQQAVYLASAIINSLRTITTPFAQRPIDEYQATR